MRDALLSAKTSVLMGAASMQSCGGRLFNRGHLIEWSGVGAACIVWDKKQYRPRQRELSSAARIIFYVKRRAMARRMSNQTITRPGKSKADYVQLTQKPVEQERALRQQQQGRLHYRRGLLWRIRIDAHRPEQKTGRHARLMESQNPGMWT